MPIFRRARVVLAVTGAAVLLGACSSDDETEREQLVRAEIRDERREAARAARQDERLKHLERQLREAKRGDGGAAPATEPSSPSPSTPASSGDSDSWPADTSAWTVVLASAASRGEAEQVAARASSAGLGQVGILFSSNYSSLHAGYWVAYTGVLDRAEADGRQAAARAAGFGDAYAREVSP